MSVTRFDFVKYPMIGEDGTQEHHIGRMYLCFKFGRNIKDARDLVFVRRMRPAPRGAAAARGWPVLDVEKRSDRQRDPPGMSDKLGTLYTWAVPKKRRIRGQDSEKPVYDVLAAENVDTTAPMMPNWVQDRAVWSVSHGVFDNRYLLPPRRRPPFRDCDCQKEKDSESENDSESDSRPGSWPGSDIEAEMDSDSEDSGAEDSEDPGSGSGSQKDSDPGDSDSDT